MKRGERRKKTFAKVKRNARIYDIVTGASFRKFIKDIGRFKKDRNLRTRDDDNKTNSEWFGKRNYRSSDKKRSNSCDYKMREWRNGEE